MRLAKAHLDTLTTKKRKSTNCGSLYGMPPPGILRQGDPGFTLASSSQDFTPFQNRDNQRIVCMLLAKCIQNQARTQK